VFLLFIQKAINLPNDNIKMHYQEWVRGMVCIVLAHYADGLWAF
jgi:hypothetical protein